MTLLVGSSAKRLGVPHAIGDPTHHLGPLVLGMQSIDQVVEGVFHRPDLGEVDDRQRGRRVLLVLDALYLVSLTDGDARCARVHAQSE